MAAAARRVDDDPVEACGVVGARDRSRVRVRIGVVVVVVSVRVRVRIRVRVRVSDRVEACGVVSRQQHDALCRGLLPARG